MKQISRNCKATVKLGEYSRGGKTRGNNQAQDHDLGEKEKYIPCGIVDKDVDTMLYHFSLFASQRMQAWQAFERGCLSWI